MQEIFLSFLSVIGVSLLVLHFFDFLLYRKFKSGLKTIADLRKKTTDEVIELLELISTVRSKTSGAAALNEIVFFIDKTSTVSSDALHSYLNAYSIPGIIVNAENADPFLIK